MILNLRVTEAAIEWLRSELHIDEEQAGEVAQMVINLCDKSAIPDPRELKEVGYQVRVSARELIAHLRREGIRGDMEILSRIHTLERALEELAEEGIQKDGLPRSIFDPDAILWDIHKTLARLGHYPNKYTSYIEAIEALAAHGPGESRAERPEGVPFGESPSESLRILREEEGRSDHRIRAAIKDFRAAFVTAAGDRSPFAKEALRRIDEALRPSVHNREEGEGSEDRLYKTAKTLIEYHEALGDKIFLSQFGTLDILDPCRKIVAEGEGNPHPWE